MILEKIKVHNGVKNMLRAKMKNVVYCKNSFCHKKYKGWYYTPVSNRNFENIKISNFFSFMKCVIILSLTNSNYFF